jgi:hypothetical protein
MGHTLVGPAVPLLVAPPLFILLVLLFPGLPRFMRRVTLWVTDKLLFFHLFPKIPLVTVVVAVGVMWTVSQASALSGSQWADEHSAEVDYKTRMELRAKRWRGERNFWIALFSTVLWLTVWRVRAVLSSHEGDLDEERRRAGERRVDTGAEDSDNDGNAPKSGRTIAKSKAKEHAE